MLFHTGRRAPADCPYGKGGSKSCSMRRPPGEGPRLLAPFPQHTTYLVVETDDAASPQAFLRPGANRCR
jgi:hypothetical protein